MKKIPLVILLLVLTPYLVVVNAQQQNAETRVSLSEPASAIDAGGANALQATLRTTAINGAPDAPVTNATLIVKNVSSLFYSYISGVATFYDASGVRCGEGLFKGEALAPGESIEADIPGIRIRCSPATWRIVATNLIFRVPPGSLSPGEAAPSTGSASNFLISVDGEEHPIQLNRPMVLTFGDVRRTIIVRQTP